MSQFFEDLHIPETPSAITTDLYKQDGIYVGEAIIKRVLKNGKYRITLHDNRVIDARAVFNIGENVLPTGIAVHCIVHNADGFILGRVRVTKDEAKSSGETKTDSSEIIGTSGDAMLRPHAAEDKDINSHVTVTRGGVVKLVSTGATSFTLHPIGERIIQKSQSLLAFCDAYRIESGRTTPKAGVSLKTLTTQSYKDKVGPIRTEVRVKNGSVSGTTVHQFSVDALTTASGVTTGIPNFKWTIDTKGSWEVSNTLGIKFGQLGNEPVVLGKQLVTLLKALIQDMTAVRTTLTGMAAALSAAGSAVTSGLVGPQLLITPIVGAALVAFAAATTVAMAPVTAGMTVSIANLNTQQTTFLTPLGISKELILSDFFSTQKIAPVPVPFTET